MEHYTLIFTGTEYRTEFQMRSFRQVVLSEDYRHALAWVIYDRDYALEEDQKLKKNENHQNFKSRPLHEFLDLSEILPDLAFSA